MNATNTKLQFPLRLNVAFALSESIYQEVQRLNTAIVAAGNTEIDFCKEGAPIPHITLLMGTVEDSEALSTIAAEVRVFAEQLSSIRYSVTMPYLRLPSKSYIFIDVLPQPYFHTIRKSLYNRLQYVLQCEEHGGPNNVSHITVGYSPTVFEEIEKLIVDDKAYGLTNSIILCKAGFRGTCIEILDEIEVKQRPPA